MMECKQAIMDSYRCCYRVGKGESEGRGGGGVVGVNLHTPVEVAPTGSIMVGHKRKSNTPRSHPGTFGHEKLISFGTFYAKIHREEKKRRRGVSRVL